MLLTNTSIATITPAPKNVAIVNVSETTSFVYSLRMDYGWSPVSATVGCVQHRTPLKMYLWVLGSE